MKILVVFAIALLGLGIGIVVFVLANGPVAPDEGKRREQNEDGLRRFSVKNSSGEKKADFFVRSTNRSGISEVAETKLSLRQQVSFEGLRYYPNGNLLFWWDEMPSTVNDESFETGPESNIHPDDYAGADSCAECHQTNFDQWSEHPHRWMNAEAKSETVKGDFSDTAEINYLGGRARFSQSNEGYQMTLTRDDVTYVYQIDQTLGSRFFQYYIGTLTEGPFPEDHPYRTDIHVLPFGYWLKEKQWIPVVHVGPELPDGYRTDPFAMPMTPETGKSFLPYTKYCNMCHSTFPLADNMFRKSFTLSKHSPGIFHLDMAGYLAEHHEELLPAGVERETATTEQILSIPPKMTKFNAGDHGSTFGISCEACHFGCAQHVADPKSLPSFAAKSEFLRQQNGKKEIETGRTHENLNWACGRCHTGNRPEYSGGMSTWNSTEYTDAMKGSCYSQLKCIDCHSPHQATGMKWTKTPMQDDATCTKCHEQFLDQAEIAKHTHHPVGTEGSRCMNCHMPKINEGLQDVVRTHTIFSPTMPSMIESNHPNACNLCHTDQNIDWTTKHLKEWYGANYSQNRIAASHRSNKDAVGLGWLKSDNEAVRLTAIDAIRRNKDHWAMDFLIDRLDDSHLLNRQFAQQAVQELAEVDLDDFGYQFFMTPAERREPIEKIRAKLIKANDKKVLMKSSTDLK